MARRKKPTWTSKINIVQIISILLEASILLNDSPFMTMKQRAVMAIGIGLLTILFRHLSKGEQLTFKPVKDLT